MSALNCFLTPDAAHLFTDGVFLGDDKTIVGIAGKVLAFTPQLAVVGAVGRAFVPQLVHAALTEGRFDNFDAMANGFADVVRSYSQKTALVPGIGHWGKFKTGIAGWSSKSNAPAFVSLTSYDDRGTPAFEVRASTRYVNPFSPSIEATFNPEKPEESGLEILRAQRAERSSDVLGREGDRRTYHLIGGFAQYTKVTRDSIEMRILERWPDVLGRQIVVTSQPSGGNFF